MCIPDRVIVRKIQEYDPHLFVIWNNRKRYFEVWRHMPHGRRLVTPITRSIYEQDGPITYAPLDERILVWLYEADGHRRNWTEENDRRFFESNKRAALATRRMHRDMGKDMYSLTHQFTVTKYAKKNDKYPKFNHVSPYGRWVPPDVQARTSPRLRSRSALNAKMLGFRR